MVNAIRDFLKKTNMHGRLGAMLLPLLPETYISAMRVEMLSGNTRKRLFDALIQHGIIYKYYSSSSAQQMSMSRTDFWSAESGKAWHSQREGKLPEKTLPSLLRNLEHFLDSNPATTSLIEIGCGNGELLHHLASEFPQFSSVVGIDLNQEQTLLNRKRFQNHSIEFICGEAIAELQKHRLEDTVILTHGTLEYFCPEELNFLFSELPKLANKFQLLLSEPITTSQEKDSLHVARGYLAYSHAYSALLENHGYTIASSELIQSNGTAVETAMNVIAAYGPQIAQKSNATN